MVEMIRIYIGFIGFILFWLVTEIRVKFPWAVVEPVSTRYPTAITYYNAVLSTVHMGIGGIVPGASGGSQKSFLLLGHTGIGIQCNGFGKTAIHDAAGRWICRQPG